MKEGICILFIVFSTAIGWTEEMNETQFRQKCEGVKPGMTYSEVESVFNYPIRKHPFTGYYFVVVDEKYSVILELEKKGQEMITKYRLGYYMKRQDENWIRILLSEKPVRTGEIIQKQFSPPN